MKKHRKVVAVLLLIGILTSLNLGCAKKSTSVAGAFKIMIPDWSQIYDDREGENAMVYDQIKKKYKTDTGNDLGIDLQYYPGVSYTQQVNMAVADAKSNVDAFSMYSGAFLSYAAQPGLLMDLTSVIEKYGKNLKEKIPEKNWKAVTYKGKIMGIPDSTAAANDTGFIRMDVLKSAGITKVPSNLVELEAAFDVFLKKGMIPFRAPYWQAQKWLSGAFGLPYSDYLDENGKYKRYEENPNFKTYIETLQRWRVKGYLPPDYDTVTWQQNQLDFQSGKQGLAIGWYSFAETAYPLMKQVIPNVEIAHINVIDSDGTGPIVPGYAPAVVTNMALHIFANSKNAQAIVQYLDWMVKDVDNYMLTGIGIPGVHYDFDKTKNELTTKPKYIDPAVKGYQGMYSLGWTLNVFGKFSNPKRILTRPDAILAANITQKARAELDSLKTYWSATQDYGIIVDVPEVVSQGQSFTYNMNVIASDYIINKSSMTGFEDLIAKEISTCKASVIEKANKNYYDYVQSLIDTSKK